MQTAIKAFADIQEHASANSSDATQRINPVIGQVAAQGDVNFLCLAKIPDQAEPSDPIRQLAPGPTRGSRHCIREGDLAHVDFFVYPDPNPLEGPILRFNAETVIEHPEHGDHIWPAGSIVAVGYQRQYADDLRRIQD